MRKGTLIIGKRRQSDNEQSESVSIGLFPQISIITFNHQPILCLFPKTDLEGGRRLVESLNESRSVGIIQETETGVGLPSKKNIKLIEQISETLYKELNFANAGLICCINYATKSGLLIISLSFTILVSFDSIRT